MQLELAGGDGDGRNLWLWPAIAKREDGRNEEGGRLVLVTPSPLPARSFTVSKIFYSFADLLSLIAQPEAKQSIHCRSFGSFQPWKYLKFGYHQRSHTAILEIA